MAALPTLLKTTLQPDAAVSAAATFTAEQRAYIDLQIRVVQDYLARLFLNGVHGTYYTVDGSSASLTAGDVVCTTSSGAVTLATAGALNNAVQAIGVCLIAAAPNTKVCVAIFGTVPPTITGLGNVAGYVRVSSAGRCERVAALSGTDYAVGTVTAQGYLSVSTSPQASGVSAAVGLYFQARVATSTNSGLSGLAAIDGRTPVTGDRILARAQATQSQNGIWVAAAGAWSRATDFAAAKCGAAVYIEEGTDWGGQTWVLTTVNPFVVGTDAINFGLDPGGDAGLLPAHSGEVRVSCAGGVMGRDKAEGGDVSLIKLDNSTDNNVRIGQDTLNLHVEARVKTGGFFGVYVNNTQIVQFDSSSGVRQIFTGSVEVQGNSNISIKPSALGVIDAGNGWYLETAGVVQVQGNSTGLGFFNVAPTARSAAYSAANHTTDRALNETADTLVQVANVLGTLILDLQAKGLIG